MSDLSYLVERSPHVTFGAGSLDTIAELVGPVAVSVLIVADPTMESLGVVDRIRAALKASGKDVAAFSDIKSDPTEMQVEDGIAELGKANADTVVAVGGGSALDAGKAIAALSQVNDIRVHRLCETPLPPRQTGLVAIPTTAGTGSEATRTSILSGEDHTKYWYWGEGLATDSVILDPELTISLPRGLTAATGADALVHAIEAATSKAASPASCLYAHEAIRLLMQHLETAVLAPEDMEARGGVLFASFLAGRAINHAGTALAHCFGHALGSMAPVHHGRAVSIAMAAGAEFVARGHPKAFATIAGLMGADEDAEAFAPVFSDLMKRIGLDLSLPPDALSVTAEGLVAVARDPANIAMLDSTSGEFNLEVLGQIAERIVAQRPAII